jgi:outer membrane protein
MNKTFTIASLITALGFASAVSAQADIKVGYVDMAKVFSSYYKTKEAENRVNEARATAKKELDDRVENYTKNGNELNKLKEEISKPELSKDAKEKKAKEYDEKIAARIEMERDINEFKRSREQALQEQAVRMRDGIVKEINAVIQDKVKVSQFDLVLDKSGNSINGVPVVLYSRDTSDFSDEVISVLNKNKPKDGASEAAAPAAPAKKK